MNRRHFLQGLAGILAAGVAPYVVTTAGVLMPVRKIVRIDDPIPFEEFIPDEWIKLTAERMQLIREMIYYESLTGSSIGSGKLNAKLFGVSLRRYGKYRILTHAESIPVRCRPAHLSISAVALSSSPAGRQ